MTRIFISYRRDDSAAYAGRLGELIGQRYGQDQVFIDVESVHAGATFSTAIELAFAAADVMLVVIGARWLVSGDGRRRLDEPEDFVRLELEAALRRNIRIVPVLVGGATLPDRGELPAALQMLNYRQAIRLSDAAWESQTGELLRRLDLIVRPAGAVPEHSFRTTMRSSLRVIGQKLRLTRPH